MNSVLTQTHEINKSAIKHFWGRLHMKIVFVLSKIPYNPLDQASSNLFFYILLMWVQTHQDFLCKLGWVMFRKKACLESMGAQNPPKTNNKQKTEEWSMPAIQRWWDRRQKQDPSELAGQLAWHSWQNSMSTTELFSKQKERTREMTPKAVHGPPYVQVCLCVCVCVYTYMYIPPTHEHT